VREGTVEGEKNREKVFVFPYAENQNERYGKDFGFIS
jgi:hypothetical protein